MSLISAIYDAIFTETPSDVTINERSFISVLIDSNNKESFKMDDFRFPSYKGKYLILSRHIIHFVVTYIVLGIIWFIYGVYNIMHWTVTGKLRGMKSSSGINFIIGSIVLVSTIIALLYIMTFLVKEVVLSPNNARINNKGVITVDQPCLETHSFFLINSATYWTSTDIQVSEGDKVFITASGSMYSDVYDMYLSAYSNKKLDYQRNVFAPNFIARKDIAVKYCIYGRFEEDDNAQFGSLLYQICTNHKGPIPYNDINNRTVIKQMDFSNKDNEYSFIADHSGVLYLTFNDVLLDTITFHNITDNSLNGEKAAINLYEDLKRVHIYHDNDIKDERIWFQDNLGEVLINVRIEKNLENIELPLYKKIMVYTYRRINHMSTHGHINSTGWIILFVLLGWFIFDIIISMVYNNICNGITIKDSNSG